MNIKPIPKGMKRQWVRCKECGNVACYDFIPFSLANPILTLPCGHGAALRWEEATENITADDAMLYFSNEEKEEREYAFVVTLFGTGTTVDEAWEQVISDCDIPNYDDYSEVT